MSVKDAVEDINYLDSCHHQLFVANFTIVVVRKSLHAQILNLAKFYFITYCFVTKKIGIFGVRFISAKFPHSPIHHYTSIYGALLFSVSPVRCTCIIKYGAVRKFFLYFFSFGKISRFAGPLNIFVSFLVPVNKKIHRTKFEMEEENTK